MLRLLQRTNLQHMILIKHIEDLQHLLNIYSDKLFSIGFVPTMGALHPGHLSLVEASRAQHPITVCSIFVNPTQFNNPVDFQKYPITLEKDISLLESSGCDILFLPDATEMYPEGETAKHYDLGYIESILEGTHRPGHFQGVCRIVDKFLKIIQPHTIYLGQKDYQQCMVIRKMISLEKHMTNIEVCDTLREQSGLAMSSRNMRLGEPEKKLATALYATLQDIKNQIDEAALPGIEKAAVENLLAKGFKVDYVTVADASSLVPVTNMDPGQKLVGLIAASIQDVRLIDNLILN